MNAPFELALDLPARVSRRLRRELHNQVRSAILDGRLAPGVQLPASRAFAQSLGVSRNTVVGIYDLLLGEGYIVSRPGAGIFVADGIARKKPTDQRDEEKLRSDHINSAWRDAPDPWPPAIFAGNLDQEIELDFRPGFPDTTLFPFEVWRRLSDRTLREFSRKRITYQDFAGSPALRTAIAGHVSFTRAVACGPQDIVVTRGAQHAFDLLARVLVTRGKTVVAVEDPGYPPARAAFAAAGATVAPTPVDAEGLIVDRLRPDVSIIYVTPSHQCLSGVPMSPQPESGDFEICGRAECVDRGRRFRRRIPLRWAPAGCIADIGPGRAGIFHRHLFQEPVSGLAPWIRDRALNGRMAHWFPPGRFPIATRSIRKLLPPSSPRGISPAM